MRRKSLLAMLVTMVLLFGLLFPGQVTFAADSTTSHFKGGNGSENAPYLIANAEQLDKVRDYPNAHFKLIDDIDLGVPPYNGGKGWEPIGSEDSPFAGSLDGDGHTIKNLYIDREDEQDIGLFGVLDEGSRVKNLNLENVDINGGDFVGGLVGWNNKGQIKNICVSGIINGEDYVGGLAGGNGGIVTECYADGEVSGNYVIGGLVGENYYGSITDSYAEADVSGEHYIGGLVGSNWGDVAGCYATGDVDGDDEIGGLVGYNEGEIKDCYATGNVRAKYGAAGLVGWNFYNGEIIRCYATGNVNSDDETGGLVAYNNAGKIFDSYYDSSTTGQSDNEMGQPKITEEMKLHSTYKTWDFVDVWVIEDGESCPILRWQDEAPQWGFGVSVPSTVEPVEKFKIEISNAKDEKGYLISGNKKVTVCDTVYGKVYGEDGDGILFQLTIEFDNGKADFPITLNTPGRYELRVRVEDILYSNLVTLDVLSPIFAGGSGTEEDPYQIAEPEHLYNVRYRSEAYFKLIEDIDLNNTPFNKNQGWRPIGSWDKPFTGSFDGNGKTIRNLYINRGDEDYVGLFGCLGDDSTVMNVTLKDVNVTGRRLVGGIAGWNNNGSIIGSTVSGAVYGCNDVGGLLGENDGYITDCHSTCTVTGSELVIGGLVGDNGGEIADSSATGSVTGIEDIGGLVGYNKHTLHTDRRRTQRPRTHHSMVYRQPRQHNRNTDSKIQPRNIHSNLQHNPL